MHKPGECKIRMKADPSCLPSLTYLLNRQQHSEQSHQAGRLKQETVNVIIGNWMECALFE